jgi:hypothetical protein
MEDLVDLARPVIEVRELVETFLGYDVVLDDWQDIVGSVLAAISGWVTRHPAAPAAVTRLATGLTALLQEGWGIDRSVIEQLSADAAALLPAVVPATVPRPDEEHRWAFPPS